MIREGGSIYFTIIFTRRPGARFAFTWQTIGSTGATHCDATTGT